MKQVKITMPRRVLTLVCGLILAATAFAQEVAVKGHVVDKAGEPIIGATVRLEGRKAALLRTSMVTSHSVQTLAQLLE